MPRGRDATGWRVHFDPGCLSNQDELLLKQDPERCKEAYDVVAPGTRARGLFGGEVTYPTILGKFG